MNLARQAIEKQARAMTDERLAEIEHGMMRDSNGSYCPREGWAVYMLAREIRDRERAPSP